MVLPSRPTDVEAGGSGAAEAWAGPPRRGGPVRRQRISSGGDFMLLHHKNKYDFKYSLYPVFMISGTHYIIVLYTSLHDIMGFGGFQGYQEGVAI